MATLCPASLDDNEVANSDSSLRKFNCATMNREALRATNVLAQSHSH